MKLRNVAFGILAGALLPAVASAQGTTVYVPQPTTPNYELSAGGGVNTFTTEIDKDTDTGWAWNVRGVYGIRSPLGVEAAYVGSTNPITNTGRNAFLLRNGGEALLRGNLMAITGINPKFLSPSIDIQPYVAAGFGLTDQRVTDDAGKETTTVGTRTFEAAQTIANVPAAVGIDAFIMKNIAVGARAAYKWDLNNRIDPAVSKTTVGSFRADAHVGVAF